MESAWTTFSRRLAFAAGIVVPAIETCRRWGDWVDWPSILEDYIAGAFLLLAAFAHRRGHVKGPRLLSGAWGFATGMMYLSFVGQLMSLETPDPSGFPAHCVVAVKAAFLLLSLAGLFGALAGPERTTTLP